MGAKTGVLAYAEGDVRTALRQAGRADLDATTDLIGRLRPDWPLEVVDGSSLGDGIYPPEGIAYAAAFPGIGIVCDRRLMVDYPSQLPEHLVEAGRGRTMLLHAMHSVVDWLAFAVWQDGHLIRSLSLSPDSGIVEDIGDHLPFEAAYWAGKRPVEPEPGWDDEEPYALPFHPLELGEDALRALFGFVLEGSPDPDDLDPYGVQLHGYRLADPDAPARAAQRARLIDEMRMNGSARFFGFGPDGRLVERSGPTGETVHDVRQE